MSSYYADPIFQFAKGAPSRLSYDELCCAFQSLFTQPLENKSLSFKKKWLGDFFTGTASVKGFSASQIHSNFDTCYLAALLRMSQRIFDLSGRKKVPLQFHRSFLSSSKTLKRIETQPVLNEVVDRLFGLDEWKLKPRFQDAKAEKSETLYTDLAPEDLFTPFTVLHDIKKSLIPFSPRKVVDLGSGLGRICLYLNLFLPKTRLVGVELLAERIEQAQKSSQHLKINRVSWIQANLNRSTIPDADIFILFNPFSRSTLAHVFTQLVSQAQTKGSKVLVMRVGTCYQFFKRQRLFEPVYVSKEFKHWEGNGFTLYQLRS